MHLLLLNDTGIAKYTFMNISLIIGNGAKASLHIRRVSVVTTRCMWIEVIAVHRSIHQ